MAISQWVTIGYAATGLSILAISTRLIPFHHAHYERIASPTHWGSFAVSVVTPPGHRGLQENFSLLIPAKRFGSGVSDEEVLARFTRGFFSGLVFTPERWLLGVIPFQLTDISAIKKTLALRSQNAAPSLVVGPNVWATLSISRKSTPSVASLLFGNFLVLDSSSLTRAQRNRLPDDYARHAKPPHAFVELAWGGKRLGLVGSHRFEVSRQIKQTDEAEEFVKITFSVVSCTPKTGLAPSKLLEWFHLLYARLLFSDGIRDVLAE